MASPLLLMRAPTITVLCAESLAAGDIDRLSSSVNCSGRSLTCLRRMASGMREPSAGRANTNTVSLGAALPASADESFTLPLTRAGVAAALVAVGAVAGAGLSAEVLAVIVATGGSLPSSRASAMLPCTWLR